MKVAEILASKRPTAITIKPSDTVATLSKLIREHRIGAAVVSADGRTVDGVISERDIAYGIGTNSGDISAMPVSAFMTKTVTTCAPSDAVATVAATMLARNFRHVPVIEGQRLVGMVSIRDVLKVRLDELQQQKAMLLTQASQPNHAPQDR